jgi:hypothetical protein
MKIKTTHIIIATLLALLLLETTCNEKPKETVKTTINIEQFADSIRKATLNNVKPVYIDTVKTQIKWLKSEPKVMKKDSIIYVENPNENTIESKEYDVTLKSNEAKTDLKIVADNLYSISGVTTYPKEIKTIERTKYINESAFFIYAQMPVTKEFQTPEIGVLYNLKNNIMIGAGLQYTNQVNANITLALKL